MLTELIKRSGKQGLGWFRNHPNRVTHKISGNDLGPNGDHDGWISIGENARSLGVDPKKAEAFQRASFGFNPSQMPSPELWEDRKSVV